MLGNGRVTPRTVARAARRAALTGAWALAACTGDGPRPPGADTAGSRTVVADRETAARSLAARRSQRCDGGDASLVVDSAGIGPVLVGDRVGALAQRCTITDTALALSEGMRERAHRISVGGRELIVLSTSTADTSIIRIITSDRAFRTAGGVGVGSSVESLRAAHGRICAARGEGDFVVMAADLPGVSFAIDWSPPAGSDPGAQSPFAGGDPGTALDAARIERVWVHGVVGGCRVGVA